MFAFQLRLKKPQTIIQVGAHSGNDALIAVCREYGHRLYMFEPNPRRVEELRQKAGGCSTVRVIPKAVSNVEGRANFNIAAHDDCSSLQPFAQDANQTWVHPWHPYKRFETVENIEVDVIRLDTFFKQEEIGGVDFLLIDAQGEDLRVVQSLGDRARDVKKIQMEINIHAPLYQNSFGLSEALAFMDSIGFDLHASWKQSLNREVNAVFRNRRLHPGGFRNAVTSFTEQHTVSVYQAWQKMPQVIAVTRMMLGKKVVRRKAPTA